MRRRIAAAWGRLVSGEDGAALMVFAMSLPVFVLGLGLGAETTLHFMVQRKLQHTADTAAHAGAVRLRAGGGTSDVEDAARSTVLFAGLDPEAFDLAVSTPPFSGASVGDANSVEVTIIRPQDRFFSRIVENAPLPIRARAVASITGHGAVACVLSTARHGPGITSSATVTLEGCDVASNSTDPRSIVVSHGELRAECAHTVAASVSTVDGLILTGCDRVDVMAPLTRDPYADVSAPQLPMGACDASAGRSSGGRGRDKQVRYDTGCILSDGTRAGVFDDGLKINGNESVSFEPGLYILRGGDFRINGNADLSAEGVTFYLTDGASLRFNGNGDTELSAPTSGPYAGLLFFEDRAQSVDHRINGNADMRLQGALYLSRSALRISGSSTSENGCTQIIADTIDFAGSARLQAQCETAGTREIVASEQVRITE